MPTEDGRGRKTLQPVAMRNLVPLAVSAAAALALGAMPATAQAPVQKRCGWLVNPTPANWYFFDRDGRWVLGEQGGYQISLADLKRLPEDVPGTFVADSRGYGYNCVCLNMRVDQKAARVTRIASGSALPLKRCRTDKRLPKM